MEKSPSLDVTAVIVAPAGRVMKAFFDADALTAWWQVRHSVTTPRALGPYAIEWAPTEFCDDILGRLGGVFRGTVMHVEPGHGFFVADAFWLPPDGNPMGPMALEVHCEPQRTRNPQITLVNVTQRASEDGDRWKRYYEVIAPGWERALKSLKRYLESTKPDLKVGTTNLSR